MFADPGHALITHRIDAPEGIRIVDLVSRLGFASTKGEARRLVKGRGVRIDGRTVDDDRETLPPSSRTEVAVGKRRRALVEVR